MKEIEDFLDRVKGRRSKEGTISLKINDMRCFSEWCESNEYNDISDIGMAQIEDYLAYLGRKDYSGSVINNRWWTLNIFFNEMIAREKIEENPLGDVNKRHYRDLFNGTKKKDYVDARGGIYALEPEGVEALANNVESPKIRNELIVRLMYHTGVRRQELADIKLDNIDRNERKILVYSQKKDSEYVRGDDPRRPVWYGPSLDPLMDRWIEIEREGYVTSESDYLFNTQQTERISERHINDIIKIAANNADLQEEMYEDVRGNTRHLITSHTLRHSFARNCMTPDETGSRIDVKRLSELMGHSDPSITAEKYLHFAEDDVREARELYGPR
jgi:integrase/recombinase XerD